jgi:DNA-binding transcriptional MerR regulator
MSDSSPEAYAAAGGYPIGMVATLTGLPADVIRAWERRYGLPRPARTVGGHRLYSPREVALLRRAALLRGQGLPAGAACAQARAEAAPPAPANAVSAAGSAATARLSARLHTAASALDAAQVGAVLAEAAALLDVATLWRQVVAPALQRLGADWAQGLHTPAPEHLLSTAVRGRLAALLEAAPRVPGAPRALLGPDRASATIWRR